MEYAKLHKVYIKLFGIGEIIDRLSIVEIFKERKNISCDAEVEEILQLFTQPFSASDMAIFLSGIGIDVDTSGEKLYSYFHRLFKLNNKIWGLESEIRKSNLSQKDSTKIAKNALEIRDLNWKRQQIKTKIYNLTKTGVKLAKSDYWHKTK